MADAAGPRDAPRLLLATRNAHKVEEISLILRRLLPDLVFQILSALDFPEASEPEETGSTFEENARIKARYYADKTGILALADDSGLVVDALEGRPGVRSARYADTAELRIERVLKEVRGVEAPGRTARFVCAATLGNPAGEVVTRQGILEGWIAEAPRGTMGFGYDPIFVPSGDSIHRPLMAGESSGSGGSSPEMRIQARTLADYSLDEKNSISHRARAIEALAATIREAIGEGRLQ